MSSRARSLEAAPSQAPPATAPPTTAPPTTATRSRFTVFAALALILLLAAALRFHQLTAHCLWLDEIFSVESSAGHGLEHLELTSSGLRDPPPDLLSLQNAGPWWNVATALARDDNHPPLYFILLRIWRTVLGDSPMAVRSLSVLFSVAAIGLFYTAARELHGRNVALWAALIMAVAGPQLQFAQEARAYALLLMLGCGACAAVARIERRGPGIWRLTGLAVCVLSMMLTHYYAIAACLALGLYAVIRMSGAARRKTILALLIAAAGFSLIWGRGALQQRGNVDSNNFWIVDPHDGHLARTAMRAAAMPIRLLFEPMRRAEPAAAISAILYVIPFLMLRRRPDLLLWGLWLVAVVAMPLATDLQRQARQLEFLRYTLLASPAVYALVAGLLHGARPRWLNHALPAVAAAGCIVSLPQAYLMPQTPKPDWRELAGMVDRLAQPDDVMILFGEGLNFSGAHYLALRYYARRLPDTILFTAGDGTDADLVERLRGASGVWTVVPPGVEVADVYIAGLIPGPRGFVWGLPTLVRWTPSTVQPGAPAAPARPATTPSSVPAEPPA